MFLQLKQILGCLIHFICMSMVYSNDHLPQTSYNTLILALMVQAYVAVAILC